jgi:hypothetical protein
LVAVVESAFVRDCRGIGQMVAMCRLGKAAYSVSGGCGGGRDIGVKGKRKQGWEGGERRREWRKMQRK